MVLRCRLKAIVCRKTCRTAHGDEESHSATLGPMLLPPQEVDVVDDGAVAAAVTQGLDLGRLGVALLDVTAVGHDSHGAWETRTR